MLNVLCFFTALTQYNITTNNFNTEQGYGWLLGVSFGFERFKLKAHYIYGFLNTFDKLNDQNLNTTGGESNFKGNQNMIVLGAMFLF